MYGMKVKNDTNYTFFGYYLLASIVTIYAIFIAYAIYVSIYLAHFDFFYLVSFVKSNLTFAYVCWKFQFLIFGIGTRFYLLNVMFK